MAWPRVSMYWILQNFALQQYDCDILLGSLRCRSLDVELVSEVDDGAKVWVLGLSKPDI